MFLASIIPFLPARKGVFEFSSFVARRGAWFGDSLLPADFSKVANDTPDLIVVAHKKMSRACALARNRQPHFQPRPALKDIVPQSPDGDAGMCVRLAETVGKDPQRLLHARHIRVAEVLERGEEARTEQDGGFSHGLAFR